MNHRQAILLGLLVLNAVALAASRVQGGERGCGCAVTVARAVVGAVPSASLRDEDFEAVWPPKGPAWETDPAAAFERARSERKAVMAFIATEG